VAAARKLADLSGDAPANADDRDFALRLVADLDPFDADTHVNLGRRLLAKNSLQPALVEFQAALALGPSNLAEAHTDVGRNAVQDRAQGRSAPARAAGAAAGAHVRARAGHPARHPGAN
jgi:tetratricopeptide (TPR) repeat protein